MELPRRLSKAGPLIEFIAILQNSENPDDRRKAKQVIGAVRSCIASPDGAILLDLLEKSTLFRSIAIDQDPRALDANNAQSFIALDLRRILSDEFNEQTDEPKARVGGRRSSRKPTT